MGELQKRTELSIELEELRIKEENFIMHFPVTKTWNAGMQEDCTMYVTKLEIVTRGVHSAEERFPFFEVSSQPLLT